MVLAGASLVGIAHNYLFWPLNTFLAYINIKNNLFTSICEAYENFGHIFSSFGNTILSPKLEMMSPKLKTCVQTFIAYFSRHSISANSSISSIGAKTSSIL